MNLPPDAHRLQHDKLPFGRPVVQIIRQRYSCRAYTKTTIAAGQVAQLAAFAATVSCGPLGTPVRFELAVAMEHDPKALRGLGTYGLIKDPAGFIVGAAVQGPNALEDYGYALEIAVLHATGLGLDTCWLGGNFAKSSFSKRIRAGHDEIVPSVASMGYAVEGTRSRDRLRQKVRSDTRLPWDALFFQSSFATPLTREAAGAYALPLDMLRLAPSGHNYQPWRVVQDGACFHFYLQRTPGYGPGSLAFTLLGVADLQRVEMGIAMCHFELAARELGLAGQWILRDPDRCHPHDAVEYIVTWVGGT